MPSKKYVLAPIDAYQYKSGDDAQIKEFEKLGLHVENDQITGPTGNTLSASDGDYIAVDSSGDIRVYGKDYFEQRYVAQGGAAK